MDKHALGEVTENDPPTWTEEDKHAFQHTLEKLASYDKHFHSNSKFRFSSDMMRAHLHLTTAFKVLELTNS